MTLGSQIAWDDTVLDLAFEVTDHLSVHAYFDEADSPDLDHWLAVPLAFERHIRSAAAIARSGSGVM